MTDSVHQSMLTDDAQQRDERGIGLTIARAAWVALALTLMVLSAIAVPAANATLQSVCAAGTACIDFQLRPYDLQLLHQIGLSPAFLAAYQLAWDLAILLLCLALGALLWLRRPNDPMALLCAFTLALQGGASYTGLLDVGLRPLAPGWYWPVSMLDLLAQSSLLIFFLIFPNGHFVPRWTRWGVFVIIASAVQSVFFTDALHERENNGLDFFIFAAIVLSLVALQVYRFRRVSSFRERQQTKWVVYGFSVAMLGFVTLFGGGHAVFPLSVFQSQVFNVFVVTTLTFSLLALIPISICIAVLRSRLYDVDVAINRTLVYGSLTAILVAVYFGSVVAMQQMLTAVTRQSGENPVVIVLSTLLIAALFQPLRRSIQSFIDRRYYRRKYDAAKTLNAFSATMRQDIDLAELRDHLLGVVDETMQPEHVSLWLSQAGASRSPERA